MKLKLAMLLFVALAHGPAPAAAQVVGAAQSFAVVGNTTVTNTGATMLSGNLGVSPGTSITGFPPGTLASGAIYTGANAVVVQAQANALTLYNALVAKPCTTNLSGTDLGGLTLTPGVYCFNGAATLTAGNATLTLDAQNGSGVFVFQIGTTLTTGTNSAVNVINGNAATGVFWQLGTSATLDVGTLFTGNILANASVTLVGTARILCGRALALNGAVTMDTNTVSDNCTGNSFDSGRTDFGSLGFAGAHAATHDFNGDGYSDILWRDSTSGTVAIWDMNGSTVLASSGGVGGETSNWQIVGTGDFNGDGKSDILWRDGTSGTVAIWEMNGSTVLPSSGGVGGETSNWQIVGTGDFNGDGFSDILWRDNTFGTVAIWEMNGSTVIASFGIGGETSNWQIAGTGDFNGDGTSDILWRDSTSGMVAIWEISGATVIASSGIGAAPSNWQIAGTGDFNGDGKSDILWRDSNSGTVAVWEMNGSTVLATLSIGGETSNWQIAGTGDFNGDGFSDILWRDNTSGTVAIWEMNGSSVLASFGVGGETSNWQIQSLNSN